MGFAVLIFACGCGGKDRVEEEPNPACSGEVQPEVLTEVPAAIRGSVRIRDVRDFTVDESGRPRSVAEALVQADFGDFSAVTSTPSALMELGASCVGVVSRPTRSGSIRRLDLASLVLRSGPTREVRVSRASAGVFSTAESELIFPGSSALQIVGEAAPGGFPGFDEALSPVVTMDVTSPAPSGDVELSLGELAISWRPSDGDYVQVTVTPEVPEGMTSPGGQILCFVSDDGCFVVPGEATRFLLASQRKYYSMSVERVRHRAVRPDESSTLEIDAISEWRATLVNGVIEL